MTIATACEPEPFAALFDRECRAPQRGVADRRPEIVPGHRAWSQAHQTQAGRTTRLVAQIHTHGGQPPVESDDRKPPLKILQREVDGPRLIVLMDIIGNRTHVRQVGTGPHLVSAFRPSAAGGRVKDLGRRSVPRQDLTGSRQCRASGGGRGRTRHLTVRSVAEIEADCRVSVGVGQHESANDHGQRLIRSVSGFRLRLACEHTGHVDLERNSEWPAVTRSGSKTYRAAVAGAHQVSVVDFGRNAHLRAPAATPDHGQYDTSDDRNGPRPPFPCWRGPRPSGVSFTGRGAQAASYSQRVHPGRHRHWMILSPSV
jgi:hypothetical protein